uniref:Uncharacterized protein n=1 Tax=Timema douglasi TaxID=61478 RepID=A0A7R8VXG8_TIMDO|nr:unnamed protein product [Timema douglasi]
MYLPIESSETSNHQDWPTPIILNRRVGRASYDVPTRRSPLRPVLLTRLAWLIIPQAWSWTVFNMTFNSWRLYVALCTLPSLMAGILISFYDESPKFLLSRGHSEEALHVLRKIYAVNTGRHPDTYPVKAITFEKSQVSQKPTPPPTNTTLAKQIVDLIVSGCKQATPLFKAPHLTSAALVFSIQFGSLLSMNTIRLWMPQLFFIMEDFSKLQAASVDDHSLNSYSICEMLAYTDNIAAVAAANRSLSALSRADTCTVKRHPRRPIVRTPDEHNYFAFQA